LEALNPSKASRAESWASLEPVDDTRGTLWLCIPVVGKRHESLQLGVGTDEIVGGWQDRHYAWDDDRQEAFRVQVADAAADDSVTEAFDWLHGELQVRGIL
jgi:hypothetical protein